MLIPSEKANSYVRGVGDNFFLPPEFPRAKFAEHLFTRKTSTFAQLLDLEPE